MQLSRNMFSQPDSCLQFFAQYGVQYSAQYSVQYSAQYSLQYSAQYSVQYSAQYSLQYSAQYSVQYSAQYTVQYSAQYTVQYSAQYTVQFIFQYNILLWCPISNMHKLALMHPNLVDFTRTFCGTMLKSSNPNFRPLSRWSIAIIFCN